MSLQDKLIAASTAAFNEALGRQRKVRFDPSSFKQPTLPPVPTAINSPDNWPDSFHISIDKALDNAWAPGTIKNYTHSIKTFLAFCQKHHIPDQLIFPSSDYLVCAFIASQQASN